MKKLLLLFLSTSLLCLGACSPNNPSSGGGESLPVSSDSLSSESSSNEDDKYMTVTQAIALANQVGEEGTKDRQYVTGTVKSISNPNYGEMYITDGTNDLYIYGVYSSDGAQKYPELEQKPYTGDEVFLYGIIKTYNGKAEMGASWLQKMVSHQGQEDLNSYKNCTVLQARSEAKGSKVRLTGVVAKINYANGMVPNGFYLIDGTSSIYVYGKEVTGRVEEGEEIEIAGVRDDYILDSEKTYAEKFGYQGAIQITDTLFIKSNGKGKSFDKSWIESSSVKDMLDTPLKTNITSKVFKVNAIINKAPGSGFTNYYINDLDNKTGSYVYSMCNGSDYSYLDTFDGKICTVYLAIHNAKSTNSGIVYRLLPIAVEENKTFSMNDNEVLNFALKYYGATQFLSTYNSDPELEVLTSVSNQYVPFSGVELSYSSDKDAITFVTDTGKTVMHVKDGTGIVNVTITAKLNGKTATLVVPITVGKVEIPETKTIAEAIATADNETVTVRGIVMSGVVNQTAFYLNDGTGVIAARTDKETLNTIELGHEVIVQGTRKHVVKDGSSNVGQSCIDGATLIVNLMGKNDYSTSTFITDKSFDEIFELKGSYATTDLSTNVYVAKCYLVKKASNYSTNYYLSNQDRSKQFLLYASSGSQYSSFDSFVDKEITVTFMLCDWNTKSEYRVCIVSTTDGTTTVLNSYNFK